MHAPEQYYNELTSHYIGVPHFGFLEKIWDELQVRCVWYLEELAWAVWYLEHPFEQFGMAI